MARDLNETLGFSELNNGWTSFYSFIPEDMVYLKSDFYTFKNGNIYKHNAQGASRNTFYGNTYPSEVETIINQDPETVKNFRAINLEGSSSFWRVEMTTDLDKGGASYGDFSEKERLFKAHIRTDRDESLNMDRLTVQGLGTLISIDDTKLFFRFIDNSIHVGDNLYKIFGNKYNFIGRIVAVFDNYIVLDGINTDLELGQFCFSTKDPVIESYGLKGYFSSVKLTNYETTDIELFAVSTEATKSSLQFKGYQGDMIPSEVTGKMRLKFDHSKPFVKPTLYYNTFKASKEITIPAYYGIPKGYWKVLERLALNNIQVSEIQKDTTLAAQVYYIKDYKSRQSPYEGHYLHYNTQVTARQENIRLQRGDYLVSTNQEGIRYLLETLEPEAVDSFFNWNFFDTILQQKEGFSPYVWEDKAKKLLENNPILKIEFETKKKSEPLFASNWYAQLDWLHKHSPNYEQNHLRYPIIRVGG